MVKRWLVRGGLLAAGLAVVFLPGYAKWHELGERKRQLQQEIADLERRNREDRQKIQRLKSDPDYIEQVAREEMRVAKPGEVILELPPPPQDQGGTPSRSSSE